MRCKTCDYRLWNLVSRKCPECGTEFRPSEFKFIPHTVRFCCPHCGQDYYGADENGHLVPASFTCGSCGRAVHMDEMVLLPTEGVEEDQTEGDALPWLRRKQRGGLRAWLATVGLAMVRPQQLMRMTPLSSPRRSAWWFAIFTTVLIALVSMTPFVLMVALVGGVGGVAAAFEVLVDFGVFALVFAVGVLTIIAVWGLTVHGLLRLTGKTAGPVGRTYQAICYSSGANVPSATPCVGIYLGWIWWLISAVLTVKEGQRVSGGRATLAVLPFPALLVTSVVFLYGWLVFATISGRGPFGAASMNTAGETEYVLESVLAFAEDHKGEWPGHAVQLAADEYLMAHEFVSFNTLTLTTEASVPVSSTTLDQFDILSSPEKQAVAQAAGAALPEETTAHRLGDFVFTYHGIDLENVNPDLWLVIWAPDPDQNPPFDPSDLIQVGRANGTVREVPLASFPEALSAQNALRLAHGMPSLRSPLRITHTSPAVAAIGPDPPQ